MSKAGSQERFRTLFAQAHTVKDNSLKLMAHFDKLSGVETTETHGEGLDPKKLPKCELFDLKDYFSKSGSPWVFTGEMIGTLYILASALNTLCSHLEAFKPDKAARYKSDAMPQLRVLSEAEALIPTDASAEAKALEASLRDQCLMMVAGPVMRANPFATQLQTFIKEANDQYASKGGLPAQLAQYIKDMEVSAGQTSKDIALELRARCASLRDETLLRLGDSVFGELCTRSLQELLDSLRQVQNKMSSIWKNLDSQRADHEKRLGPRLANPNAEQELQTLIDEEAARFKAALVQIKEDKEVVVVCLRKQADLFVVRLAAAFEATVRLLDAVPLPAHFAPLPGDDQVEPVRMSIKRRMRRLQKGQTIDETDNGLVVRNWEGFRRYELRQSLRGDEWPKDKELADATPEMLAELTPTVASFRSATHKKLFARRGFYYERYKSEFLRQVANRAAEISARENKEQAGQTNWNSMVKQLNPEAILPEVKLEEEVEEEVPPVVAAPKTSAKKK